MQKEILLVGGTGVLGESMARSLRNKYPDLGLIIAGRNLAKAQALADALGNASASELDINNPEHALPDRPLAAIAVLVKDYGARLTDAAGERGVPIISLSSGGFEIGAELFHGLRAGARAPVVIASHWFAGGPMIAALDLARGFDRIDEIEIAVLVDRGGGESGPATMEDFTRIAGSCPSMIERRAGRYEWVGSDTTARFAREDGSEIDGTLAVSCDVMSLGAITGARDIRVMQAFDTSLSFERGDGYADEVTLRVKGVSAGGAIEERRRFLTAPREPYGLTTITAVAALERMAGLRGHALVPGVYSIEAIFTPSDFMASIVEAGVKVGGD